MNKHQARHFFILTDSRKLAKTEPYFSHLYSQSKWVSAKRLEIDDQGGEIYDKGNKFLFKRMRVLYSSWAKDGRLEIYEKSVREWMRSHYRILDTKEIDGIFIDLYGEKIN